MYNEHPKTVVMTAYVDCHFSEPPKLRKLLQKMSKLTFDTLVGFFADECS